MFHTHPSSPYVFGCSRYYQSGAAEAGWEALENLVVYLDLNVNKTCKIVVFELLDPLCRLMPVS
jgi:hypothetical protein